MLIHLLGPSHSGSHYFDRCPCEALDPESRRPSSVDLNTRIPDFLKHIKSEWFLAQPS